MLNMLMLHRSPGPWRPFLYLGEAMSCCQVDLAAVRSLNIIVTQCILFPNRAKARWGEAAPCCSRKGLSQSTPLSHQQSCPAQHHRATSQQFLHYGSWSGRGLLGPGRQTRPVLLGRKAGHVAQGLRLGWRGWLLAPCHLCQRCPCSPGTGSFLCTSIAGPGGWSGLFPSSIPQPPPDTNPS